MAKSLDGFIEYLLTAVGYLEKKDGTNLGDLTDTGKIVNAGSNNYTIFWQWYKELTGMNYQADYWCGAQPVSMLAKYFGYETAKKLLNGSLYIYCPTGYQQFKNIGGIYSSPQKGDFVFFWSNNLKRYSHTGFVISTTPTSFTTVEGNTSAGNTVVRNGGSVAKKTYPIGKSGAIFGRPKWDEILGVISNKNNNIANTTSVSTQTITSSEKYMKVKEWQTWMNKHYRIQIKKYTGKLLEVDGIFGEHSRAAALCVWKYLCNKKFGSNLNPANVNFGTSCRNFAGKALVKYGSKGTFVYIMQGLLMVKEYYTGILDAICEGGSCTAIQAFEKKHKLAVDSSDSLKCSCGQEVWDTLFNS